MSGVEPSTSGNEDADHASDKENQRSAPTSPEDYSSDYSDQEPCPSATASGKPETSAAAVAAGNQSRRESGRSPPPSCSSPAIMKLLLSPPKATIPSSLVASELQGFGDVRNEGASLQVTEARGGGALETVKTAEALYKAIKSTEAEKESVPGSANILKQLLSSPPRVMIPPSLATSELQGRSEGAGLQDTEAIRAGVPEAVPISEAVHQAVQDTVGRGGDVAEAVSKTVKGTEVEEESISEAAKSTEAEVSNIPEGTQSASAEGGSVLEAMQVAEANEGSVPESVQDSVPEVEMSEVIESSVREVEMSEVTEENVPEAVPYSVPEVEIMDATGSNVPEVAPPKSEVPNEEMQTSKPDKDFKKPSITVPSGSKLQKMKNRFEDIKLESPKRQSERLKGKLQAKRSDSPIAKKERKSSRSRTSDSTSTDEKMTTRGRSFETESNVPEPVQEPVIEVEMSDTTGSNVPEVVPDVTAVKDGSPAKSEVVSKEMQTSESDKNFKKPSSTIPSSSKQQSSSSKKERKSSRSKTSERSSSDERMTTRGRRFETESNVPEPVQDPVSEVDMCDATGSNIPEVIPPKSEISNEEMQTAESDKDFKKPSSTIPASSKEQSSSSKKERKSSRSKTSERSSSDERMTTRSLRSGSTNSEDSSGDETRGKRASRKNSKK